MHRFAVLTAAATLALIFTGGLVTSTGSGLAVPDWPLSFGQFFPEMVGGVRFEHGHRMVAGAVGLLTLALAIRVCRREPRRGVRRLALAALAIVVVQAVLGGVTVLMRLPIAVSVAHACLAQSFFCMLVALAVVTGRAWKQAGEPAARPQGAAASEAGRPTLFALSLLCFGCAFVQLALGATMRHMGAGLVIPDFPLSFGAFVPPQWDAAILVSYLHRLGALLLTAAALWLIARVEARHAAQPILRRPARLLAALLVTQVTLGALTIWTGRAVVPTTLHVAAGAAILGVSVVLALRAWRLLMPAAGVAPDRATASAVLNTSASFPGWGTA